MPRLNLVFLRGGHQTLGTDVVHYERIKTMLAIGNSGQVRADCLVDTGSPLSVFPQNQWERFENDIHWLYTPGTPHKLPAWLTTVTGLGAKSIKCRIGKVRIRVIELPFLTPLRLSPAVEIIAKFPLDKGLYSQILLGLGGGAFASWRFITDYPNAQAWLEYP